MGLVANGGDGSPTLAAGTEEAIPPTGSPKRTDREAMPPLPPDNIKARN